jgi:hypothetical protein
VKLPATAATTPLVNIDWSLAVEASNGFDVCNLGSIVVMVELPKNLL